MNAADYAAVESLRDGRPLQIRALHPADRAGMREALLRTSEESRYRRFFAPKRAFSEREVEYYLNIDFVSHVALVALLEENGQQVLVGGGRYIVTSPGRAEVAFSVDDPHQNLGIASRVMRHLVVIARESAIEALDAEVLSQNAAMLKVFERCGHPLSKRREAGVVHVTLDLLQRDPQSAPLVR